MHCFIAAIPSEINGLVQNIGLEHSADFDYWLGEEERVVVACLGVGYLEAALNLQRFILKFPRIKKITFCGTAGIYPGVSYLKIGDLCQCREVTLCDASAEMGTSAYIPLLQHTSLRGTVNNKYPLVSAKIATTLSITIDNQIAQQIRNNTQAELENMELYGIAKVCNKEKIIWNAILGLTNYVGPNGRNEWQSNHKMVEELMGKLLYSIYRR